MVGLSRMSSGSVVEKHARAACVWFSDQIPGKYRSVWTGGALQIASSLMCFFECFFCMVRVRRAQWDIFDRSYCVVMSRKVND
jgi:hypothetical protein